MTNNQPGLKAMGETEEDRISAMLARDAEEAVRNARRGKHQYFDQPAALRHYEVLDGHLPEGWQRYRHLPPDHGLVRLFQLKKITAEEFDPGNVYRIIFERANDPAGKDSTAKMLVSAAFYSDGVGVGSADRSRCRASLAAIHSRMGTIDGEICRLLCGLGFKSKDAVSKVVICNKRKTVARSRKALRALAHSMEGVSLPEFARGAWPGRDETKAPEAQKRAA